MCIIWKLAIFLCIWLGAFGYYDWVINVYGGAWVMDIVNMRCTNTWVTVYAVALIVCVTDVLIRFRGSISREVINLVHHAIRGEIPNNWLMQTCWSRHTLGSSNMRH